MNINIIGTHAASDYALLHGFVEIIADWEDRFDTQPALDLNFTIDALGLLRLNGIALCPANQLESPCSLLCDDELFRLKTTTGQVIEIYIVWPFGSDPYISRIVRCEDIYVKY